MNKLIKEGEERKWYLVKEFTTKAGLPARIQKCVWDDQIKSRASMLHDHYTGYVQKREGDTKKYYDNPDIEVHGGVTFEDSFDGRAEVEDAPSGVWVGFDMAHIYDEKIPNQEEYAEKECEKLAKQMI